MNIFKVSYEAVMKLSQGMTEYEIPANGEDVFVLVNGTNHADIRRAIESKFNPQTRFIRFTKTEWIGKSIN